MANCHSKSKAPVEIVNDRRALRNLMQRSFGTDLERLHGLQEAERARRDLRVASQTYQDEITINHLAIAVKGSGRSDNAGGSPI